MKWNPEDLKQYVQAKEYIDSIIIPLQAFQLSDEAALSKDAYQKQVLSIFVNDIEKELSGRVLLTPTYNYFKFANKEEEVIRLNEWITNIKTQPFTNIFLLTFEPTWKKVEKSIDGELIWLPGIGSGDLQDKETITLIRNQVEQISELLRSYW